MVGSGRVAFDQRGAVMLVVLVLVTTSTLGGLAMMRSALFHQRVDQVQQWQGATFEAAESALAAIAGRLQRHLGDNQESYYCHRAEGTLTQGGCDIPSDGTEEVLLTEIQLAPARQGYLIGFATDQVSSQLIEAVASAQWVNLEPASVHWQRWQRPQLAQIGLSVSD